MKNNYCSNLFASIYISGFAKTHLNQLHKAENEYVQIYQGIQFKLMEILYSEDLYRVKNRIVGWVVSQ
jgi:hypothetical protein